MTDDTKRDKEAKRAMKKAIKLLAKLPEQEKQARADVQRFYTDPTPAELTRGTFRSKAIEELDGADVDVSPRANVEITIDAKEVRLTPARARELANRLWLSADVVDGRKGAAA